MDVMKMKGSRPADLKCLDDWKQFAYGFALFVLIGGLVVLPALGKKAYYDPFEARGYLDPVVTDVKITNERANKTGVCFDIEFNKPERKHKGQCQWKGTLVVDKNGTPLKLHDKPPERPDYTRAKGYNFAKDWCVDGISTINDMRMRVEHWCIPDSDYPTISPMWPESPESK